MKKRFLFLALLLCISSSCFSQGYAQTGQQVYFTVQVIHPTSIGISKPKSPVQPPEVYLDGHTLYIASSHADYTLVVEDTDETEVYQTSVPSSVSTVVLPSSLSGTYILKLETDTFVFEGEIEL